MENQDSLVMTDNLVYLESLLTGLVGVTEFPEKTEIPVYQVVQDFVETGGVLGFLVTMATQEIQGYPVTVDKTVPPDCLEIWGIPVFQEEMGVQEDLVSEEIQEEGETQALLVLQDPLVDLDLMETPVGTWLEILD